MDVETTPSDDGDRVLSIGVVTCTVTSGGSVAVTGTLDLLCDPGVPIENRWFHGIRDADVAGKPPPAAHIPALNAAITAYPGETLYFVAQNAAFDVGVLKLEYNRASPSFPALPVLDTLDLSRVLGAKAGSHKLAAHFHVTERSAHVARDDALAPADVLGRLLDLTATNGHDDLVTIRGLLPRGRRSTTDIDARPAVRVASARSRTLLATSRSPANRPPDRAPRRLPGLRRPRIRRNGARRAPGTPEQNPAHVPNRRGMARPVGTTLASDAGVRPGVRGLY